MRGGDPLNKRLPAAPLSDAALKKRNKNHKDRGGEPYRDFPPQKSDYPDLPLSEGAGIVKINKIMEGKMKKLFQEPTLLLEDLNEDIRASVELSWNDDWGDDWATW